MTALEKQIQASEKRIAKFKKNIGKTPTEFLTEIRITHACHLIDIYKKHIPLSDIAERCGYTDYVYFSRRFKQITGTCPNKYIEYEKNWDCREHKNGRGKRPCHFYCISTGMREMTM